MNAKIRSVFGILVLFAVLMVISIHSDAFAQSTKTTGNCGFHGAGEVQEFGESIMSWTGKFWGMCFIDGGAAAIHGGAWDCTGLMISENGVVERDGGYCTILHPNGDKIELRWQITGKGSFAGIDTKGTYLSGTGQFAGISGGYIFRCDAVGSSDYHCKMKSGEYSLN